MVRYFPLGAEIVPKYENTPLMYVQTVTKLFYQKWRKTWYVNIYINENAKEKEEKYYDNEDNKMRHTANKQHMKNWDCKM